MMKINLTQIHNVIVKKKIRKFKLEILTSELVLYISDLECQIQVHNSQFVSTEKKNCEAQCPNSSLFSSIRKM